MVWRSSPKEAVAFEVDALDDATRTGWSIVVKGTAEEPKRLEDYLSAEDLGIEPWAQGDKAQTRNPGTTRELGQNPGIQKNTTTKLVSTCLLFLDTSNPGTRGQPGNPGTTREFMFFQNKQMVVYQFLYV